MVSTRRKSALGQVLTAAGASPVNAKILATGQRGDMNDRYGGPLMDLEEKDEEEEDGDYVDDTAILSDSASEGDSGSDWETKSTLSDSILHMILETQ